MPLSRLPKSAALALIVTISLAACTPSAGDSAPPMPASPASRVPPADPRLAHEMVGKTLPAWSADEWLNSPPLTLDGLRGRVVLVRWFTDTTCPFCSATAPSLNGFDHDYSSKGLTVIGMYHHKDPAPLEPGQYAGIAKTYGFGFPVALDTDWKTLKSWWLTGRERTFTSVSFLIDRQGRVRGIHKGGKYAPGDADYDAMKHGIETLLAER